MEKNLGILMADLSGYTAATEIHGGIGAANMVHRFMEVVSRSLRGSGILCERVGDQVVITSASADDLWETAVALQKNARQLGSFLPLHVGLHYGEVYEREGSFYGSTINLASRIMAKAKPGQVLSSMAFIDALIKYRHAEYLIIGTVLFKNMMERTEVAEMVYEKEYSVLFIDPVCNMQLTAAETEYIIHEVSEDIHFCSEQCLLLFEQKEKPLAQAV